jgi:hypothetical protein
LPPVEGEGGGDGASQTAGTGLAIALVGAIFLLSMGKKGVKGKRL